MERLGKLEVLELHDNQLTVVPPGVGVLGASVSGKLRVLRLERNRISSLAALTKCSALIHLK